MLPRIVSERVTPPDPQSQAPSCGAAAPDRHGQKWLWAAPVLLVLLIAAAYASTLDAGFVVWDDGGKSVKEPDCAPFEPGTKIERRYSAEHYYERAGNYSVQVILRRSGKVLRKRSVRVNVRAGLGDPTETSDTGRSTTGW